MRQWMLCAVLILVLPLLACEFSVNLGGETPEPTAPLQPREVPTEVQLATPVPPTPTGVPTNTPLPPTATPLPTATPAPGFGPVSFSVEVEEGTNKPIDPATVFPAGVTKIYANFEYWGMREGMEWTEQWYRAGQEILLKTEKWSENTSGRLNNYLFYPSGRALDSGSYEVRYYIEGQLVQSGTFVIQ